MLSPIFRRTQQSWHMAYMAVGHNRLQLGSTLGTCQAPKLAEIFCRNWGRLRGLSLAQQFQLDLQS